MDTHFSWLAVLAQGLTDTRYPTMTFLLRIFAVCHVSLSGCCNANADPDAGETTLRVPRPALECLCEHGWKPWGGFETSCCTGGGSAGESSITRWSCIGRSSGIPCGMVCNLAEKNTFKII